MKLPLEPRDAFPPPACVPGGRHRFGPALALAMTAALLCVWQPAQGQGRIPKQIGPITLSGSAGTVTEFSGTSGVASRREPFSSQLFANFTASAYRFSYGLNLVLSTQESRFGQSFNRAGLNLRYRWIAVQGGTIAPPLSQYSLNNLSFRGGFVELTPGPVVFTVTGGRSQKPIAATTESRLGGARYARWLYGVRLGVGDERKTHFHLVGLYASDDTTSIPTLDRAAEGTSVLPAQNVSLSPDAGVSLFDGKLNLRVLGTVSAFTRDLYSEQLDVGESGVAVPSWFLDLFTPTTSTRVDYAGQADLRLSLPILGLQLGYERVQPGFESLGLSNIRKDHERLKISPQVNLFDRRVRLSARYDRSRNNLLELLTATRYRRQTAFNAQARVNDLLVLSGGYSRMANETRLMPGATRGTARLQLTQSFTFSPVLTLRAGETMHSLTLMSSYQTSSDRSASLDGETPAAPLAGFSSANVTGNYTVTLASGWALNGLASYLATSTQITETQGLNLNAGVNRSFFDRALTASVAAAFSWLENSTDAGEAAAGAITDRTLRQSLNVNVRYRAPFGGYVTGTLNGLLAAPSRQPGYREVRSSLRYEIRF